MAFLKAAQPSENDEFDEFHEIAPRTDYENLSEEELGLAYEDACWAACNSDDSDDSFSKNKALLALKRMDAIPARRPQTVHLIRTTPPPRTRQRGAQTRSQAKSGDSNADDPEPERPRLNLNLYDQAALAAILCISKKTLQNQYSVAPHTLPPAISIPGARGPRWTPQSVQEWLSNRPRHTPKPIPQPAKKKVGRPRIALVKQGGAA